MKYLFFLFILASSYCVAQEENASIQFNLNYNGEAFGLGNNYAVNDKDSLQVDMLRFYISDVKLLQDEKVVYEVEQKHFLIDADDKSSQSIPFAAKTAFNQIQFCFGVDSLTNVSGAYGGDLDPSNGMYWTWQSGYINFKLEGTSSICETRNNAFQYHLGGYMPPFNTMQTVLLPVVSKDVLSVSLDVAKLFHQIELSEVHSVMSPNAIAVELSAVVAKTFSVE